MKFYIKKEGFLYKLKFFKPDTNIAKGGAFKCFTLIQMRYREGEKEARI